MTQFPSQRNLSSWAGICPGNNRSAGKNRSNRPTGGNPWLRGALTECAWAAAAKKNCFLKEKFWRITTKSRGKKNSALLAVARTILQLVYEVLRTGQPYRDRQVPALFRPSERPLDPPLRPQIGQTWGPSSFAQRRRWFPEGTIRELIETGRSVYFRKTPCVGLQNPPRWGMVRVRSLQAVKHDADCRRRLPVRSRVPARPARVSAPPSSRRPPVAQRSRAACPPSC